MHRTFERLTAIASALSFILGAVLLTGALSLSPSSVRAASVAIAISGNAFVPANATVNVGDTVVWTSKDVAPHTATTTSGPASFDSGILTQSQTFSYTFTIAGNYAYYCVVHPEMTAAIKVAAPAAATPAPTAVPAAAPTPASQTGAAAAPASPTQVGASSQPDTAMELGAGPVSGTAVLGVILLMAGVLGLGRQVIRSAAAKTECAAARVAPSV